MTTEVELEQMLAAAGCSAERVTSRSVDRKIKAVTCFTAAQGWNGEAASDERTRGMEIPKDSPLQLLTICVLVLENGFMVVGTSACASPENFREEIGKQLAFEDAREKIWQLEGYLLKEKLFRASEAGKEVGVV